MVLLLEKGGISDAKDNMVGSFIIPHCVIAADQRKIQAAHDIIKIPAQITTPSTQTDKTIVVASSHAVLRLLSVKLWDGKVPDFMGAGAPLP